MSINLQSSLERLVAKTTCVFFFFVVLTMSARAGWVEDTKDGKTIIHVIACLLPTSTKNASPVKLAEYAVLQAFIADFPKIFQERYLKKYAADSGKYGKHNWRDVSIQLHPFTGTTPRGQGVDAPVFYAISKGTPPDVLYVNSRTSTKYIQNALLYPLDKKEDGYFSSMSSEEIKYSINDKLWPVINRKGPNGEVHLWAKPTEGILVQVVIYRKDLLAKHDIPCPKDGWTWDDLLTACKKIANHVRK